MHANKLKAGTTFELVGGRFAPDPSGSVRRTVREIELKGTAVLVTTTNCGEQYRLDADQPVKTVNRWHGFTLNYSNLTEAQIAKIEKALIETAEQLKDDEDIPFEYGGGSNIVTTDSGEF
jgi:hypothetical protein